MKLSAINENNEDIAAFHDAVEKYATARGKGNINKEKAVDDADKTEQPDRSGNQIAPATDDPDALSLLGADDNSRDAQFPSNMSP